MKETKITIFDTTLRDGELMPGIKMNIQQKIHLAKRLEAMQVDVIEVGYPGAYQKDFDEIFMVAKQVKGSVICGLASSKLDEIASVALAIKPAQRGRIHLYTPVNLHPMMQAGQTLEMIKDSVNLARNYCIDVEWTGFDATRSEPDFLCRAIETAIHNGATTIGIPDSFGIMTPLEFSQLIDDLMNRVPNIDRAILSVHCHNDRGLAVENSIAAMRRGARQIECSIHGIGARQGNANLAEVVRAIEAENTLDPTAPLRYGANVQLEEIAAVEEVVNQMRVGQSLKI